MKDTQEALAQKETLCKVCSKKLRGRTDKKFCSKSCSNSFHAQRQRNINKEVLRVNRLLRENRRLLQERCPVNSSPVAVDLKALVSEGFDFEHYTGIKMLRGGRLLYVCYEYCYMVDDKVKKAKIGCLDDLPELLEAA